MHAKYEVSICTSSKNMANVKMLTFDLEEWTWTWHVYTQNLQLHDIHVHIKYEVSICIISKFMTNVKVGRKQTNQQTNKQTDRGGKNNMIPL